MASTGIAADEGVSRGQLRTFYLTGSGLNAFVLEGPLRPAVLDQLVMPLVEHSYPLYFEPAQIPEPFFKRLQTMVEAHGASLPAVKDHLGLIAGAFGELLKPGECTAIEQVFDAALSMVRARMELLRVDPQAVEKELGSLRKLLPKTGELIPFSESTLTLLSSTILTAARQVDRLAFVQDLQQSFERLSELLATDDSKLAAAASKGGYAASLGAQAGSFLNTSALAEALRHRSNPAVSMAPERRARCESALRIIGDAFQTVKGESAVVLVRGDDGCEQALKLCEAQLEGRVAVWKALRIARLEAESAFDPAVHAEALETFDWTLARPGELAALPVILVVQTARQISESLTSFGRLLRSGFPLQVLVTCENGPAEWLGGLPVAYDEAFLLQSSVACTEHLIQGLTEMARVLRPAVAVVAGGAIWNAAALLPLARCWPLYRYDPGRGGSWYERFSLAEAPNGSRDDLTFAHVAALLPAWRDHFRSLPKAGEPFEQACPSIEVTGPDGEESHAVYTRELAGMCSLARSRWRMLADLAAPKIVREVDTGGASQARLEGAAQAIHRVITMLTNTEKG